MSFPSVTVFLVIRGPQKQISNFYAPLTQHGCIDAGLFSFFGGNSIANITSETVRINCLHCVVFTKHVVKRRGFNSDQTKSFETLDCNKSDSKSASVILKRAGYLLVSFNTFKSVCRRLP